MFLLLLLALAVRLPSITAPIIGAHSWRQADTAAMARNYVQVDGAFASPRVDWGGGRIVESEFPIYQYVVSLFYLLFGVQEIIGRLLSIAASLLTLVFFFFLARRLSNDSIAWWSTLIIALLPLQVFYGRAFMPEATMLMFTVLGILLFLRWQEHQSLVTLAGSAVAIALACLIKITSLYLGVLMIFLCWQQFGWKFIFKLELWIYAFFVLLSVALWYYHAHQNYLNGGVTVGIWEYGSDKWGNWGMLIQPEFWNRIFFQSLAERHLTWAGFLIFVTSFFLPRVNAREVVVYAWLAAVLFYFIVVAKGNFVHEYYQLPFIFPAAILMGKTFHHFFAPDTRRWKSSLVGLAGIGIIVLGALRLNTYWNYENPSTSSDFQLARTIEAQTPPSEFVCLLTKDPTVLYLSNRKGHTHSSITEVDTSLHCKVLAGVLSKPVHERLMSKFPEMQSVAINDDFFVFRL